MKVKVSLSKYDIPGAQRVVCHEERAICEHRIPGLRGSALQDMGTHPERIEVFGSVYGDELQETFLTDIREKYQAAKPLIFVADTIQGSDVKEVVIEKMSVDESSRDHGILNYILSLTKYISPPVSPMSEDLASAIDRDAADNFNSMLDGIIEESLLGDFSEKFSDLDLDNIMESLPSDLLDGLMELMGAGYENSVEVYTDLSNALDVDGFDPTRTVTGVAKIAAKLVVTLIGPIGDEEWVGELAEKFKEIV